MVERLEDAVAENVHASKPEASGTTPKTTKFLCNLIGFTFCDELCEAPLARRQMYKNALASGSRYFKGSSSSDPN